MTSFTKGLLVGLASGVLLTTVAFSIGARVLGGGLTIARQAIAPESAEATEKKIFPATGLRRVSVTTEVGDVRIEAGDTKDVLVTLRRVGRAETLGDAQDRLGEVGYSAAVVRGVLVVRQVNSGPRTEGDRRRELHVTVTVPRKLALRTRAHAGIGQVTFNSLTGPAYSEAGVGDVRAFGHEGALDLESGTGDVVVDGGHGTVKAEAGIGGVTVKNRHEKLSLRTGTGDIEADLGTIAAPAELETGIGSIVITATRKGNAKFDLNAGIGEVKSGLKAAKPAEGAKDETVLVLGKGDHLVSATTGTGDIRLQPSD